MCDKVAHCVVMAIESDEVARFVVAAESDDVI